jgi:hypothetical protein
VRVVEAGRGKVKVGGNPKPGKVVMKTLTTGEAIRVRDDV